MYVHHWVNSSKIVWMTPCSHLTRICRPPFSFFLASCSYYLIKKLNSLEHFISHIFMYSLLMLQYIIRLKSMLDEQLFTKRNTFYDHLLIIRIWLQVKTWQWNLGHFVRLFYNQCILPVITYAQRVMEGYDRRFCEGSHQKWGDPAEKQGHWHSPLD